jgi:hypothetical protein
VISRIRSRLYQAARIMGDANAVARGTVPQRLARKLAGRLFGRLISRLIK